MQQDNSSKHDPSSHERTDTSESLLQRALHHHKKVTIASMAFIIGIVLVFVSQPFLTERIDAKRNQLLQSQAYVLQRINRTPSPEEIDIGQQNAQARFVATQTSEKFREMQATASAMTIPHRYYVLASISPNINYEDITDSRNQIQTIQNSIETEAIAYANVLDALLLFFEYSPSVDLAEYEASSADTRQRLHRLSEGLSSIEDSLQNIEHPLANDALELVQEGQTIQTQLEEDHEVAVFVEEFSRLQIEAKDILVEYFPSMQSSLRTQLNAFARDVQRLL